MPAAPHVPISFFTPHSTLAALLLLTNTRHYPTTCHIPMFYLFYNYCSLPTRIQVCGGRNFSVFGYQCVCNTLTRA